NVLASGGQLLFVGFGAAVFQRGNVDEQLFFEVVQEQTGAGAHDRVGRHQLGMREALVDVFVDDVRFVQHQVALDQDGHLTVRVHHRDVFGLVVQVDVADFEIHAFFEQHEAAALRKGAGGSGIEHHHGGKSLYEKRKASAANLANAGTDCQGGAGVPPYRVDVAGRGRQPGGAENQRTCFQKEAFRRQATTRNRTRNSSTHTPSCLRNNWPGSAIQARNAVRSATSLS